MGSSPARARGRLNDAIETSAYYCVIPASHAGFRTAKTLESAVLVTYTKRTELDVRHRELFTQPGCMYLMARASEGDLVRAALTPGVVFSG